MTFIITLIALVIERFFHWSHLRHWQWFNKFQLWLSPYIAKWPPYLKLAACVVPPIAVIGLIDLFLSNWLVAILRFLFDLVVLIYCLGPSNMWFQVYPCITDLKKENSKLAYDRIQSMFGVTMQENSQAFHRAFADAIFQAAYQRLFAVVFWFVILGPVGAVLYRLIGQARVESPIGLAAAAEKVQQVLDWVPVRLFTFICGLGGHFKDVFHCWKQNVLRGLDSSQGMLAHCGFAALDVLENNQIPEDGTAEKETLELLDRVFVMYLVLLAFIVLMV